MVCKGVGFRFFKAILWISYVSLAVILSIWMNAALFRLGSLLVVRLFGG